MHRRAFVASGLVAAVASWVPRAHAAASPTPAETQTLRYFEIMHGPQDDDAAYQALTEIYVTVPFPRAVLPQVRGRMRTLEPHGFVRTAATEAEVAAYDPFAESWTDLVVTVEPDAPHRITGMRPTPGARPADLPTPRPLEPAALAAAVQARARRYLEADMFSGAVLVARAGKPLVQGAWGFADREAHVPNALDTQFRFGSMGKMFTAVAVMQLVQAGRLDLTAPLGTYLKDYPNAEIARTVTLNHLLTHSGGTGDIFGPEFMAHRQDLRDPKDYVALYGGRAPLFPPGSRQQYSNYGFILLGRIAEVAGAAAYDDVIARGIFAPAGMTATGNASEATVLPRRAVCYTGPPGHVTSAADTLPWRGTPAGGGYSTVGDLRRFADALMANRLLDEAHMRLLTTGGIPGPDGKTLPYDFGSTTQQGRRFLGHNGGAPGMNGELRIFPGSGHVVVVLANRDPPAAGGMANFISDRLP